MIEKKSRWLGCFFGLAIGDAVGMQVEFMDRDTFPPVTDMKGGGPFKLNKGYYTDDTIMALCLAESLIQKNGFDPIDQMNRYVNWMNCGYKSPTGKCFDIGTTTACALDSYEYTKNPYSGNTSNYSSGNGAIMRMAPIPMYFKKIEDVWYYAVKMSSTTHASPFCLTCAELFAGVIKLALLGHDKNYILKEIYSYINGDDVLQGIATNVLKEGFITKTVDQIKGSGFVIASLEAALWCFFNTDNYRDAVLAAVNLGDDTDTTAAIVGQLAGAYYGYEGIPEKWLKDIYNYDELLHISESLFNLHEQQ